MIPTILVTEAGSAQGGLALAASLAVAGAARVGGRVLLFEIAAERRRRPTLLAAEAARELERAIEEVRPGAGAASRGNLCWLGSGDDTEATVIPDGPNGGRPDQVTELEALCGSSLPCELVVAYLPPALWARALDRPGLAVVGGVIRADLPHNRALAALAVADLLDRGVGAKLAKRSLGAVAARRALAGLEPGGEPSRRAARTVSALMARTAVASRA